MLVFKSFIKIIMKNKGSLLLYVFIFVAMTVVFSNMGSSSKVLEFTSMKLNIGVVDQDNSELSRALVTYLKKENHVKAVPNDVEKLQDMIFYRDIEYVLYIPKNFQKEISNHDVPRLNNAKVPNSYTGNFMDMKVNTFINTVSVYLNSQIDMTTAIKKVNQVLETKTKVKMLQDSGGVGDTTPNYIYYYNYYSYIIVMIVIVGLGLILTQFNRLAIRRRIDISCVTQTRFNVELGISCGIFALAIWLVSNVAAMCLYHNSEMFMDKLPWLLMNSFSATMVAVGVGYMCSFIVKTPNGINGIGNTFSLAFAFLGGVFVPLEIMNKGILKISQFVPSYWYVKATNLIKTTALTKSEDINQCLKYVGIQIVFAITFFIVALVIKKVKSKDATE